MGEVTISVAGRAYQVVCEDGEEDRLAAIAARVDREAQTFGGATPSLSEPRLLLMCALLLADKLDEAESAPPQATPSAALAEIDTSALDEATARIDALAQNSGSEPAPVDAATAQVAEPAPAPMPEPAEQSERPAKSSAATAAEKDLLSWADRADARDDAEAEAAADEKIEAVKSIEPDPAPRSDGSAGEEAPETEAEREARERSERRKRRRERLARLAKEASDDA